MDQGEAGMRNAWQSHCGRLETRLDNGCSHHYLSGHNMKPQLNCWESRYYQVTGKCSMPWPWCRNCFSAADGNAANHCCSTSQVICMLDQAASSHQLRRDTNVTLTWMNDMLCHTLDSRERPTAGKNLNGHANATGDATLGRGRNRFRVEWSSQGC
jgi:hypothetical protein